METNLFKMNASRYIIEMIFRYGIWWLAIPSLIGVAGLVSGFVVDIRWLVVALMAVFILIPMILLFFFYYYGLKREGYINTVPHTLELGEDGIIANLHFITVSKREEEVAEASMGENEAEENLSDGEIEYIRTEQLRREFISFKQIQRVQIGANSLFFILRAPLTGFVWLPVSALDTPEQLNIWLNEVEEKCKLQSV